MRFTRRELRRQCGKAAALVPAVLCTLLVVLLVLNATLGNKYIDRPVSTLYAVEGVEVRRYNPVRLPTLARLNNRTHRKLLVVDGRIGFTGGAGLADKWSGGGHAPGEWRDMHYRLRGPAAAQMQAAFMDNWLQAHGTMPHGDRYFPPLEAAGNVAAQVYASSPGGGTQSMQTMYLLSIASARRSVKLSAAYFVPDNVSVSTMVQALHRGVRIQIIVPGPHMDQPIVDAASRAAWWRLLEAGAEIYRYQPSMYHCKVMIVDGLWTSVGSTNFDNRSFVINDEANLNVYDRPFALEQTRIFERDLARSTRVTLADWQARSWVDVATTTLAGLLSSQL